MVTLISTKGGGSLDYYSRKLAEYLDAPKLFTDIYQRSAELFNIPLLSLLSLVGLLRDWQFIQLLNRLGSVLHLPNHHLGRYGLFLKVPYIITVHDLIRYLDLKGYGRTLIHSPNFRDSIYLRLDYAGIKKAAKIIAVSYATMQDLVEHLSIPKDRIRVIYEGVDHNLFKPVAKRLFDFPYLLYVGSEHPRKNLASLLRAFRILKQEPRFKKLKLVKVGKAGGAEADFRAKTLQVIRDLDLSKEVVLTGYVDERELPAYYSGAECFVLPSIYEGFGFPALEAMACGCPTIVSNVTSLPEITGDAAIHVDPWDPAEWANAIRKVLASDELRKEMSEKGLERARQFSWERTARETREVYQELEREGGLGCYQELHPTG